MKPPSNLGSSKGRLTRTLLIVFLASAVATGCLWRALVRAENEHVETTLALLLSDAKNEITARTEARILGLVRMARRWERGGKPQKRLWEDEASIYVEHYPGFQAVEWADPSLHVRWVAPLKGSEQALNLDLTSEKERRERAFVARDQRRVVMSHSLELIEGMGGFVVYVPIFSGEKFGGLILGVFRIKEFFENILKEHVAPNFSISIFENDHKIYERSPAEPVDTGWAREVKLDFYGVDWRVRVSPSTTAFAEQHSALPKVALVGGLLVTLLLTSAVSFAEVARFRSLKLEATNADLEREIGERKRVEGELKRARDELDSRVQARTAQLRISNEELKREIAERKKVENQLRKTATDLARSNQDLEQFAYAASHDLKEPLRLVSSYVELLRKRYQNQFDPDADQFISFAVDGAKRMKDLIDDLLSYSRVGRGHALDECVECSKILDGVLVNLKLAIDESGAKISWGNLPTLKGDRTQLALLFQNLIGNALKFRGSRVPKIEIEAAQVGPEWEFSIADNGIGFEMEYERRIFRIFQRLHGEGEYRGTGVGLAICKKIVERHGGRIWAKSQVDKGSTFYFTAPSIEVPTELKEREAGLEVGL